MTDSIRWLALLPDPATGLDEPVRNISGGVITWKAEDKAAATKRIALDLSPAQMRLAAIVSAVDWESRQSSQQRAKLTREPATGQGVNPRRQCWFCGTDTHSSHARYCGKHRTIRRRSA